MSESMNREGLSIAIVRDSEFRVPRIKPLNVHCTTFWFARPVCLGDGAPGSRSSGTFRTMHIKYRAAAGDLVRRSRVVNDSYSGHLTHRRSAQQPTPCFVGECVFNVP